MYKKGSAAWNKPELPFGEWVTTKGNNHIYHMSNEQYTEYITS